MINNMRYNNIRYNKKNNLKKEKEKEKEKRLINKIPNVIIRKIFRFLEGYELILINEVCGNKIINDIIEKTYWSKQKIKCEKISKYNTGKYNFGILDLEYLESDINSKREFMNLLKNRNITNVFKLHLNNTTIKNEELKLFFTIAIENNCLKSLETLSICGCDVRDNILQYISKLGKLRELNLSFTKITDNGLNLLLNSFDFCEIYNKVNILTDFTENHQNSRHPKILVLDLAWTRITDKGLNIISRYGKNIKILDISNTKVSKEGTTEIIKKMPNTTIFRF